MPDVGDTDLLEVDVYPFDGTTSAAFTVLHPDGTSETLAATPTEAQGDIDGETVTVQRWSSGNLVYDAPTQWVIVAVVTGTGSGVQPRTVWVNALPTGGGITWRPNLTRVAAYVPRRTLVEAADGYGVVRRTFDDTTHPTGAEVDLIIEDATGWLLARTGVLDASVESAATGLVARRSAGWVEWGYPDNDDDKKHAAELLKQTEVELAALAKRNETLTGVDPVDPDGTDGVFEAAPVYSFPPACDTWI